MNWGCLTLAQSLQVTITPAFRNSRLHVQPPGRSNNSRDRTAIISHGELIQPGKCLSHLIVSFMRSFMSGSIKQEPPTLPAIDRHCNVYLLHLVGTEPKAASLAPHPGRSQRSLIPIDSSDAQPPCAPCNPLELGIRLANRRQKVTFQGGCKVRMCPQLGMLMIACF